MKSTNIYGIVEGATEASLRKSNLAMLEEFITLSNRFHAELHKLILAKSELIVGSELNSTGNIMVQAADHAALLLKVIDALKISMTESSNRQAGSYTQVIGMLKEVIARTLANSTGIPESLTKLKEELKTVFDSGSNINLLKVEEILGGIDLLKNSIVQSIAVARDGVGLANEIPPPPALQPAAFTVAGRGGYSTQSTEIVDERLRIP